MIYDGVIIFVVLVNIIVMNIIYCEFGGYISIYKVLVDIYFCIFNEFV